MAHARLKDVCRGAARPFTIVKKRVAGPFLERLKDLRVLGWHDPKMESAAAVIEDGVCGKLRDVRFRRAVIRTTGRKGYPHIIVREG